MKLTYIVSSLTASFAVSQVYLSFKPYTPRFVISEETEVHDSCVLRLILSSLDFPSCKSYVYGVVMKGKCLVSFLLTFCKFV